MKIVQSDAFEQRDGHREHMGCDGCIAPGVVVHPYQVIHNDSFHRVEPPVIFEAIQEHQLIQIDADG